MANKEKRRARASRQTYNAVQVEKMLRYIEQRAKDETRKKERRRARWHYAVFFSLGAALATVLHLLDKYGAELQRFF